MTSSWVPRYFANIFFAPVKTLSASASWRMQRSVSISAIARHLTAAACWAFFESIKVASSISPSSLVLCWPSTGVTMTFSPAQQNSTWKHGRKKSHCNSPRWVCQDLYERKAVNWQIYEFMTVLTHLQFRAWDLHTNSPTEQDGDVGSSWCHQVPLSLCLWICDLNLLPWYAELPLPKQCSSKACANLLSLNLLLDIEVQQTCWNHNSIEKGCAISYCIHIWNCFTSNVRQVLPKMRFYWKFVTISIHSLTSKELGTSRGSTNINQGQCFECSANSHPSVIDF